MKVHIPKSFYVRYDAKKISPECISELVKRLIALV